MTFRLSARLSVALSVGLAACSCPERTGAPPATAAAPVSATTLPAPAPVPAPAAPAAAPAPKASLTQAPYGRTDGKEVTLYTLTNQHGLVLKTIDLGAIITELHVPDRHGKLADIVLGFENLEGYTSGKSPFFGATVGRVANRIRGSKFELEGKKYTVAANDGAHHLHGGVKGWDKVVWSAETADTPEGPSIRFTYVSKDGEEGYPGTVTAKTIYTLTHQNELKVEMEAVTDRVTVVNMAHHSYWNLGGNGSGPITDHELTLFADAYTPGDPVVPTGQVKPVKGTPFDFTSPKPIGRDLEKTGGKPLGYDHNYVVNGEPHVLRPVARVKDPKSGRILALSADQPGVQFYTGNFLDGSLTGKGVKYAERTGFCLETQKFPNSINVPSWRDEVVLKPGQTYRHTMIHRFTTE